MVTTTSYNSNNLYHSEGINKPSQPSTRESAGLPLFEEEINDPTGRALGWLTLFKDEQGEYLVEYRDLAKRRAHDTVADEEAEAAVADKKAEREAKRQEAAQRLAKKFDVEGNVIVTPMDIWELDNPEPYVAPKYLAPSEWIYDITANKMGQAVIELYELRQAKKEETHE